MNSHFRDLLRLAAISALLTIAGCKAGIDTSGEDDPNDPDNPDPTIEHYIGPASNFWLLELEDGSDFEFKEYVTINGTRHSRVTGDYEVLDSEFSLFTVTSSDGDSPAQTNSELPAIAVDDDLLFVHSWFSSGQLLPLVRRGECPSTTFTANWIELTTASDHFANGEAAFFGRFEYDPTAKELTVPQSYALIDEFAEQDVPDPVELDTCTESVARDGDTQAYFGINNTALVYQNIGTPQQRIWLGLPQEKISSDDFDGDYIGFWIDNGRVANARLWNVSMSCTDFDCTVEQEIDIENLSTVGTQTFAIDLTQDTDEGTLDSPIDGFVTGTFTTNLAASGVFNHPIACSASDDFLATGDKALICVGQSANNFQRTVVGVFVAKD